MEDNKVYKCLTTTLSTDDKEHVSKEDLLPGNELVWSYKGKKYTVILKDMNGQWYCCLYIYGVIFTCMLQIMHHLQMNTSDNSAEEDIVLPPLPRALDTTQVSKAVKKDEMVG